MKFMKPCIEVEIEDSDDIIVDVPLAVDLDPDEQPDCCIYRVPEKLHKVNEEPYTPVLISIGPFHHHEEKLKKMEQLKLRYFKEALYRTKKDQKDLAKYIVENEVRIRHCYAEEFHNINSKEFITMILLDSIFIIEHLLRTKENSRRSSPSNGTTYFECTWWIQDLCLFNCKKARRNREEDNQESENPEAADHVQKKEKPWLSYNILQDLLLLENQVLFFVLKELYNSAYQDLLNVQENEDKSFHKFVVDYFKQFFEDTGLNCSFDDYQKILEGKQVRHLTDFLRYFLLPQKWKFGKDIKRLPCATKLAEAGVEFRKNMQPVLELQSFIVGDATECVIRNLTAFEQCHYPQEAIICNYIVLLDHLIDTAEDVDLLVEKKILVNWLGNNEAVATLVNKLCHQIVEGNRSCYYELSEQIRGHYSNCWSKLMASFTNLYFRDFWRGTTTVVAIVVLFFTFWNFVTPSIIHR
uniref:Uncharacterized protein n=1 Tax=Quercus lobata TaxID=97700 RepID=A0A7N2LF88_QUELO